MTSSPRQPHRLPVGVLAALPFLLLLALGTIRGGAVNLSKWIMSLGADVVNYALWQSALAGTLLLTLGVARGTTRPERLLAHWKFFLAVGLTGMAMPNLLLFEALARIPAGLGAIIIGLIPLTVYGLSLLTGLERPGRLRLLGLLMGFAGVALIVGPGGESLRGGADPVWVLAALAATLLYAVAAVISQRNRPEGLDAAGNAAGLVLAAALVLLPVALLRGTLDAPFLPPHRPADPFILFHGLVAATAFPLFFLLVALRGALFYSQTTYVIAISGILWGMLLFGERPTPLFWGASALVLGGLVLINRPLPPAP